MSDLRRYLMDEVVIGILEDFRRLREDLKRLGAAESKELYWKMHDRLEHDLTRVFDKYHALRKGGSDALKQLEWLLKPQVEWCGSLASIMGKEAVWELQRAQEEHELKEKLRQEILSEMDLFP